MDRFVKRLVSSAEREEGVLANQHLALVLDEEFVVADGGVPRENLQPASLDLRLGDTAYQLRCSFLPGGAKVEDRLAELAVGSPIPLDDGAVLAKGTPYLIPLQERLRLPTGLRARANPKSSTGRADVFTRVVTDKSFLFDEIKDGYSGRLYLEVVPLSFSVRVQRGLSLNQIRLSVGRAWLQDRELRAFHDEEEALLYRGGGVVNDAQFLVSNGLFLGLNLEGDKNGQVGYRAREAAPMLDLTSSDVDPEPYWTAERRQSQKRIILAPKQFYLLMSDEAVVIPPSLAAEMTAYDPTSGELRTHYAGFFDPGFGYGQRGEERGSTAALEVRAHDIAFMIEHRQRVCKLTFEWMLAKPELLYGRQIGSNYQGQTSTLGKHFRIPGTGASARSASKPQRPDSDQLAFPAPGDEVESAKY
jgi:dCTP deaminase